MGQRLRERDQVLPQVGGVVGATDGGHEAGTAGRRRARAIVRSWRRLGGARRRSRAGDDLGGLALGGLARRLAISATRLRTSGLLGAGHASSFDVGGGPSR